jgi:transposase-like protein
VVAILCPFGQQAGPVIRHGTNRNGTARCRCKDCEKTFTPAPKPRKLTAEKEQRIVNARAERTSRHGIARTLGVSRVTVRKARKKSFVSHFS